MYSSNGSLAFISDQYTLGVYWQKVLNGKKKSDPTWPLDATIELYDCYSDPIRTDSLIRNRIASKTKPPVTAIIGPETNLLGEIAANYGSKLDIPVILAITNPDPVNPIIPSFFNNSFLIEPPAQYQFRELITAYIHSGVKTMISVAMYEKYNSYNRDSCFGASSLASSRGINVLSNILIYANNNSQQIAQTIRNIRDKYNPDAILWCDWASCALPDNIIKYNALPQFKAVNYLPSALSMLDCVDGPNVDSLKKQGLFTYVSAPQFVNEKLRGQEYTEDFTPYASHFRPKTVIKTVNDLLNVGSTKTSPSSTALFFEWYRSVTNNTATYQTVMSWAGIDLLESAMYRACNDPHSIASQTITSKDVMQMLKSSQASTPVGRVAFDGSNINSYQSSIFIQALPSGSKSAEIVSPSNLQTSTFVYPMPTWDERTYSWSIVKEPYINTSIIISTICSFILCAIGITILIYRNETDIKLVNAQHVAIMCLVAIGTSWSITTLWQSDIIQKQCDLYLWFSYLPASFLVHLVNMKAYRLSVFIRASASKRIRRPKPISHNMVLYITIMQTGITAILLGIAQLTDPGIRTLNVIDENRPKYDLYFCKTKNVNPTILYILVIYHIVTSIVCGFTIRNATEAFKDGTLIKEALILLYMCMTIVFILQRLNLSPNLMYIFRSGFFSVGMTLFITRLFLGRCIRHWIPKSVRDSIYDFYVSHILPHQTNTNAVHADALILEDDADEKLEDDADANAFVLDVPIDESLDEMHQVIRDPNRFPLFYDVAKQCICTENVDFLMACYNYEEELSKIIVESSSVLNRPMQTKAQAIFDDFCVVGCDQEVNISSGCRHATEKSINESFTEPVLTVESSTLALKTDTKKRKEIFSKAAKEIAIMTYQNLWNKFRAQETMQDVENSAKMASMKQ
jgi:hypothetical protein